MHSKPIRTIFILIGIVLSSIPSFGQLKAEFGYSAALTTPSMRDDLLVPLAFRGFGLELGAVGKMRNASWTGEVACNVGMGYVSNRYGHGGVAWPLRLDSYIAREIYQHPGVGTIALSLPIKLTLNDHYIFSWDDAHLYWLTAHWTGLGIQYQKTLSKLAISGWIHTPLLSFTSRPPDYRYFKQDALKQVSFFFTEVNKNLTFGSIDLYRGIDAGLTCKKRLGHSIAALSFFYSYFACFNEEKAFTGTAGLRFTQTWGGVK